MSGSRVNPRGEDDDGSRRIDVFRSTKRLKGDDDQTKSRLVTARGAVAGSNTRRRVAVEGAAADSKLRRATAGGGVAKSNRRRGTDDGALATTRVDRVTDAIGATVADDDEATRGEICGENGFGRARRLTSSSPRFGRSSQSLLSTLFSQADGSTKRRTTWPTCPSSNCVLEGSSGEVTILGLLRAATSKDATGEGFRDDISKC